MPKDSVNPQYSLEEQEATRPPPLKLEHADYYNELDESAYTLEEKNAMLEALWSFMCTLVNLGWGVESIQYFLPELFEKAGASPEEVVEQKDNTKID